MTTAITPIITQLSLDRDRLKDLVNGDVNATVQLESRTEKSIAGQVADRIAALGVDLTTAVSDSQAARDASITAKDASVSAKTAAEQAKTDTEQLKTDVTQLKTDTDQIKSDTQQLYDDTQAVANGIIASGNSANPFSLKAIVPMRYKIGATVPAENFNMIGQPFDSNSDRLEFVNRSFEFIEMDAGFDPDLHQIDEVTPNYTQISLDTVFDDSFYVGGAGLNTTSFYAWRFTDSYHVLDSNATGDYRGDPSEYISKWEVFKFTTGDEYISQPTVSTTANTSDAPLDITIDVTAAVINNSARPVNFTVLKVYDNKNKIVYDDIDVGEVNSFQIPYGILKENSTYRVKAQYIINPPAVGQGEVIPPPVYSPYSETLSFTTEKHKTYEPTSADTTDNLDVAATRLFRVDASVDRTLVLVNGAPAATEYVEVKVVINDNTGVITWPAEINWDANTAPTLGATFTMVSFVWTGSIWIGYELAKQ